MEAVEKEQLLVELRGLFREDLKSVGMIPTITGIQMLAGEDKTLIFTLICEALYVQLYSGKNIEQIKVYMSQSLQIEEEKHSYFLAMVVMVRDAFVEHELNEEKTSQYLQKSTGQGDIFTGAIEACSRTAAEFSIPWEMSFQHFLPAKIREGRGCCILVFLVIVVGTVIKLFI